MPLSVDRVFDCFLQTEGQFRESHVHLCCLGQASFVVILLQRGENDENRLSAAGEGTGTGRHLVDVCTHRHANRVHYSVDVPGESAVRFSVMVGLGNFDYFQVRTDKLRQFLGILLRREHHRVLQTNFGSKQKQRWGVRNMPRMSDKKQNDHTKSNTLALVRWI